MDLNEFSFWAHEPLSNGKKACHALESLGSDVRAKSKAKITILGQDEQETEEKKKDSNEFRFWAHEPLRNGKKNMLGFGIN